MTKGTESETKLLTAAELKYLKRLNDEAQVAYQRHLEAQQQLVACLAFLREQHDTPEGEWKFEEIQKGFEKIPTKA